MYSMLYRQSKRLLIVELFKCLLTLANKQKKVATIN